MKLSVTCPNCGRDQRMVTKNPSLAARKCVFCGKRFRVKSARYTVLEGRLG